MGTWGSSVMFDSASLWTAAHQAPLSLEFSRQEYWSRFPFPTPGELPDPETETESLVFPVLAGGPLPLVPHEKPMHMIFGITFFLHCSLPRGVKVTIVEKAMWKICKSTTSSSQQAKSKSESEVAQLCLTLCDLWTVVGQAPLSMGLSRQEYWTWLPFPSPGDLPDSGIKPGLLHYRQTLYCLCHQGIPE